MNTIAPTHQSEAVLLAELQQLRERVEILDQGLRVIADASDLPPPCCTWQDRCRYFVRTAQAALVASEGG